MIMIEIETCRLLLRAFQTRDRQDLFEILSDEQWCLDGGGYHAYKEADKAFDELFEKFMTQTRYAIVLKKENKTIGLISLSKANRAVNAYEFGFGISRKFQRNGYAYEAIKGLLNAWFAKMDVDMFVVSHFPHNTASKQLIEKLGFIHEATLHKAHSHAIYGAVDLECYYLERPHINPVNDPAESDAILTNFQIR